VLDDFWHLRRKEVGSSRHSTQRTDFARNLICTCRERHSTLTDQTTGKEAAMPTRNTAVLTQIIEALDGLLISEPHALARLEDHFKDSLLVVAGDTQLVASQAEELRLAIITSECGVVLDHLAPQVRISIDQTEEAINTLFEDRFQEP
jgi:hypothetical protein